MDTNRFNSTGFGQIVCLMTNSETLQRIVLLLIYSLVQVHWTAQLLSVFQGLGGCELYVRAVQTGRAIPMQEFTADFKHRLRGV